MVAHQEHHHEYARMTIDMPFEEHKWLKAMAAFMGVTLKHLVLSCLRDHLFGDNEPNDETLKAFKETDEGKGLMQCKDFNDFINKLGSQINAQNFLPHPIRKGIEATRKKRKRSEEIP